jgi:hypothetical protein
MGLLVHQKFESQVTCIMSRSILTMKALKLKMSSCCLGFLNPFVPKTPQAYISPMLSWG